MVRQYYVDDITDISERELLPLCHTIVPPACLLGGWAVHLHVNDGFQHAYGRDYIGSRDVDFGFHIDPDWSPEELLESPIGRSIQRVTDAGYEPLSFRFVRYFDHETGEPLTDAASRELPSHNVFNLYLDFISDTPELEHFRDIFGFTPPADPILHAVFSEGAGVPLSEFRDWDIPESIKLADPAVLACMKIRSIPDRDREQKRVKDVADLHALLWYTREYSELRDAVRSRLSTDDIDRLRRHLDATVHGQAAAVLGIESDLVEESIEHIIR